MQINIHVLKSCMLSLKTLEAYWQNECNKRKLNSSTHAFPQ